MTDFAKSEIDINNFLGDSHNTFKRKVYSIAVSNTKQYFDDREKIIKAVKHELTKDMYNTVFHLLTSGKNKDKTVHIVNLGSEELNPNMPIQQVNNQAISMASAISEMLLELIDEILPHDAEDIFKKKLITLSEAPPV